jgi:hypothetical protein
LGEASNIVGDAIGWILPLKLSLTLLQKPLNAESAERAELKNYKIGKKSCFFAQNSQKISAFFARSA